MVYANTGSHPPAEPPTLGDAVRLLARLGWHLARKGDAHPGPQALWIALQRLGDLTQMYALLAPPPRK